MTARRRFPPQVYRAILDGQRDPETGDVICACGCGQPIAPEGAAEMDHPMPLHLGGRDEADNLRALRPDCHQAKSAREAKSRGKVRRIRQQGGLTKKKPSKRERALARMEERRGMP